MATHPLFESFKDHFRAARWPAALSDLDALLASHANDPALHWHRARVLERLERPTEAVDALERTLALKPDYAPALIKRVELSWQDDREVDAEALLRRALAATPESPRAHQLLATVLAGSDDPERVAESERLLDRAIALDPGNVEALTERADRRRHAALRGWGGAGEDGDAGADDPDLIVTWNGMRWSRRGLEGALADLDAALALRPEFRAAFRRGDVLHQLGRYAEAVAAFDAASALLPTDDPRREIVRDMRRRSENDGAGERDQVAQLLERALADAEDGRDRTLQDDVAHGALAGVATAIRSGKTLEEAVDGLLGGDDAFDPDELIALQVAHSLYGLAHEPPPQLTPVEARRYPRYQRRWCDRAGDALRAAGYAHVADAEAVGMFPSLGQHVLLRFFADDEGHTGAVCFAIRPKWPGLVGWFRLWRAGLWKPTTMIEFNTEFDDGTFLATLDDSPSPFAFGGAYRPLKVPPDMPVAERARRHAERVAAHRAGHPDAQPLPRRTLDDMEAAWIASSLAKGEYRRSIGYVADEELRGLLGERYESLAPRVRAKLAAMIPD